MIRKILLFGERWSTVVAVQERENQSSVAITKKRGDSSIVGTSPRSLQTTKKDSKHHSTLMTLMINKKRWSLTLTNI